MRLLDRLVVVLAGLMLVAACGGGDDGPAAGRTTSPTPTAARSPYTGYPSSLVAMGHSMTTGYNSDPGAVGVTVRTNSWATGTNTVVNSIYARILAENTAIKDHATNLSENGALVSALLRQVAQVVVDQPDLVLILIGDNDLECPASDGATQSFGNTFASALDALTKGSPGTRIFVSSMFGSPTDFAKIWNAEERRSLGGTGPCDFFDESGKLVPAKLAALEDAIHGLEEQLEAGCRRLAQCRYDDALGSFADKRELYSIDKEHLNVAGHAAVAGVIWDALKRVGFIPA